MSKREKALLPLVLGELRLPTIKKLWPDLADEASRKGWTGPEYLLRLCELEVAERHQRRLVRRIHESHLPKIKTIENYDFASITGVSKAEIQALGSGEIWLKGGRNILIFGPSGVGKTHLAAAIGAMLIEKGYRVLFCRTTELVQKLQLAKRSLELPKALEKLDKYDCLILDDFGYVQKDQLETSVLFELISERYEQRSLMITCNQPFKFWENIFQDKQMAVAAIDRLVHNASILEIEGESYRRKQALKTLKEKQEAIDEKY